MHGLGPMLTQTCERCGRSTNITKMSFFNTDQCCPHCIEVEEKHPDYPAAKEAEHKALVGGNYNFPGIGLPEDLQQWAKLEREKNKV
jgi:recombinational DNA repair protein (RecF pathway)